MAHFAKVKDGIVTKVFVADEDFIDNYIDNEAGKWIQTSYNTRAGQHELGETPLRKNFARIGCIYDVEKDAFYAPQPYPSWTLNDHFEWEPPIAAPTVERSEVPADKSYDWDEDAYQADNTTGWKQVDRVTSAEEKLEALGITKEDLKELLGM